MLNSVSGYVNTETIYLIEFFDRENNTDINQRGAKYRIRSKAGIRLNTDRIRIEPYRIPDPDVALFQLLTNRYWKTFSVMVLMLDGSSENVAHV